MLIMPARREIKQEDNRKHRQQEFKTRYRELGNEKKKKMGAINMQTKLFIRRN